MKGKVKKDDPKDYICSKCGEVHNFKLPEEAGVPKLCDRCARMKRATLEDELIGSLTDWQKELYEEIDSLNDYLRSYAIVSS